MKHPYVYLAVLGVVLLTLLSVADRIMPIYAPLLILISGLSGAGLTLETLVIMQIKREEGEDR